MKLRSVRFVKRFVLFTKYTVSRGGRLVTEEGQYHVKHGEHHKVRTLEQVSDNSVFIEFADDDRFKGSATIDKSCVELLGGQQKISDPCCGK